MNPNPLHDPARMLRQAKLARQWAAEAEALPAFATSPDLRRKAAAKLRHAEYLEREAAR